MKLTQSDLETLCQHATDAALKAGELIRSYATQNIKVNKKEAADSLASQVVTEVDLKAQDCILESLAPSLKQFDLALLTEESVDDKSRFRKDHFWCIDPMDGTLAFTEQTPGYSVSIALVSKTGDALIGVVYNPVDNTLYSAIKGGGAFKNGASWNPCATKATNTTFTFYIDRGFMAHPNFSKVMEDVKAVLTELGYDNFKIEKHAGAVLNACWVIHKAPACYFKLPKPQQGGGSIWDFAATACIAEETAAYGRSMDGTILDLNRAESTFMNHKGALYASTEELAKLIQKSLQNHYEL